MRIILTAGRDRVIDVPRPQAEQLLATGRARPMTETTMMAPVEMAVMPVARGRGRPRKPSLCPKCGEQCVSVRASLRHCRGG